MAHLSIMGTPYVVDTSRVEIGDGRRTAQYLNYLKSPEWQVVRSRILIRANGACEKCETPQSVLEVHHLTYARLEHEDDSDLEALCRDCHIKADIRRADDARYDRGLETWVSKVYGESWIPHITERMEEEFKDWLDSVEDRN